MQDLYQQNTNVFYAIDPRVKLILTLGIIICINLTPNSAWPSFILYLSIILSGTIISRLTLLFLIKRSLLALPFALAALPLVFMSSPPYITIPLFGELELNISYSGGLKFIDIFIKCWLSIHAAILFTATTRFQDVVTAMKQSKTPGLFTDIIGLMWRYLFVIADEVQRMMRARSSRSSTGIRNSSNLKKSLWLARVTGGMAGCLFLRSLERSERVYSAMVSRGYSGNLPSVEMNPIDKREKKLLLLGICVILIILILGLLTGG